MDNLLQFPKLGLEFTLKNSLEIGSLSISYYGIIIAVGMVLAMIYAFKQFPKVGVDNDKAIDIIIGGIIGGVLGARLYYVLFSWQDYKLDFSSGSAFWSSFANIFKVWEGGLAIYGGLIGALLVGIIIAKIKKVKIMPLLDVVGIGFLIGQGIGRWGNFFNIEAFGDNTNLPWGMTGPSIQSYLSSKVDYFATQGITIDPMQPVHPCFLYESIWCLVGFVLLALYLKHRKFDGEVFLMYLGYYGLGRFIIEGLRTDSLMIGQFIRVSQLLAIGLVVVSVLIIIIVRLKIKNNHDPEYLKLYSKTEEGIAILNKSQAKPKSKLKTAQENISEKISDDKDDKKDKEENNTDE